MTIERTFQGAWRISTVQGDRLHTQQYFGYTKREAIAEFRAYLKTQAKENILYKIKPGKYYLGDPCYAELKNHTWMDVLNNSNFLESACIFDDGTIVAFRTMYGDGTYFGTTGFGYSVDAGLIGLVPYEMVSDAGHEKIHRDDLMKIFDIQTEKSFCEDNGVIKLFGLEYIDTISDPDEDDYSQDDEDDE